MTRNKTRIKLVQTKLRDKIKILTPKLIVPTEVEPPSHYILAQINH